MFISDGKNPRVLKFKVGTGGITRGCLCVISSGTVVKAAAAPSAATILGIATETALANAYAGIELIDHHVITAAYTGSSKTSLVDTDMGTVFDLSDENTVNLDDTTGGCMLYCGVTDAASKTAQFVIPDSFKYI